MKETMNMDMYEAPQVEVIEVEVESGFAVSGWTPDSNDYEFGNQG
jgi:hypothetical protein